MSPIELFWTAKNMESEIICRWERLQMVGRGGGAAEGGFFFCPPSLLIVASAFVTMVDHVNVTGHWLWVLIMPWWLMMCPRTLSFAQTSVVIMELGSKTIVGVFQGSPNEPWAIVVCHMPLNTNLVLPRHLWCVTKKWDGPQTADVIWSQCQCNVISGQCQYQCQCKYQYQCQYQCQCNVTSGQCRQSSSEQQKWRLPPSTQNGTRNSDCKPFYKSLLTRWNFYISVENNDFWGLN